MRIEVLYFEGCPNHAPTLDLVRRVAAALDVNAEIRLIEITRSDEAERHRFLGSPTVRVDGEDIETARRGESNFGMSCRRYGLEGVPPRAMLEEALRRGARGREG